MKSILEQAFIALLNSEEAKAQELFHKFIVEKARQIHEANRNDEVALTEDWDSEITSESYFTEDDLSDLEDDDTDLDGEGDDDMGDMGDEPVDDVDGEMDHDHDHDEDDMGMDDMEGHEESDEDRIEHLEDELERLSAEFEAMMDTIGAEGDEADDLGDEVADDMADDEFDMDMGDDDAEDADGMSDDMEDGEDHPMEDEEYDDISESIVSELEKIVVSMEDGHGVGAGDTVVQNRKSSLVQKNKDARQGGAPVKIKQSQHKGFERETAPAVAEMKKRRNNVKGTPSSLEKVSKEGSKSAELNKLSSENGNTKSPLEGK